jgi:hypothetical protein
MYTFILMYTDICMYIYYTYIISRYMCPHWCMYKYSPFICIWCIYVYVCIFRCLYISVIKREPKYVHVYGYIYSYIYIYIYTFCHLYINILVHKYVDIVVICLHICMLAHTYIYIHTYINKCWKIYV